MSEAMSWSICGMVLYEERRRIFWVKWKLRGEG
jgi:hypothetical protein